MSKLRGIKLQYMSFCLSVFVIFSTFFNFSLDVSASSYTTTTSTYTRTYDFSKERILESNNYLPVDYEWDYEDSSHYDEYMDFWYLGESVPVFTTSADMYGYRVVVRRNYKNVLNTSNCRYSFWLLGTQEQILNGSFPANYDGLDVSSFAFWIASNNAQVQIKMAPLMKFYDIGAYDIECEYTFTIIGYQSKAQYDNALVRIESELDTQTQEMQNQTQELQNQTQEMQNQTNELQNLQNGFDSSAGDSMNDDFSASLNSYETSQDSLFNAAQSGLSGFTFVDFSSYPALVTSMSFVTSMITSVFGAMGGESGPVGIVLSVLFSVMLVSMAIGLYRYFSSHGKGGDD